MGIRDVQTRDHERERGSEREREEMRERERAFGYLCSDSRTLWLNALQEQKV